MPRSPTDRGRLAAVAEMERTPPTEATEPTPVPLVQIKALVVKVEAVPGGSCRLLLEVHPQDREKVFSLQGAVGYLECHLWRGKKAKPAVARKPFPPLLGERDPLESAADRLFRLSVNSIAEAMRDSPPVEKQRMATQVLLKAHTLLSRDSGEADSELRSNIEKIMKAVREPNAADKGTDDPDEGSDD